MQLIIAFATGLIFGLGLIIAGMTNQATVLGFLDIAGIWNPSLAFVMGGSILVASFAFHFAAGKEKSFMGEIMRVPTTRRIDSRLALGGITFGIGWGLAGFCPGPAMASLATGNSKSLIFVVAMLAGMAIFEIRDRMMSPRTSA